MHFRRISVGIGKITLVISLLPFVVLSILKLYQFSVSCLSFSIVSHAQHLSGLIRAVPSMFLSFLKSSIVII